MTSYYRPNTWHPSSPNSQDLESFHHQGAMTNDQVIPNGSKPRKKSGIGTINVIEYKEIPAFTDFEQSQNYKEMKKTRALIRGEIVSTEYLYVSHLKAVVAKLLRPLTDDAASLKIPPNSVKKICSNLEELLAFHEILLEELTTRHPNIGKIFIKYADFLKLYTHYVNGFETGMDVFTNLRSNRRFRYWLAHVTLLSPLDCMSYFIMPVQRLPRYVMLLREMQKVTPVEHRTYELLSIAVNRVETIAHNINERKLQFEQMFEVCRIQNLITGKLPNIVEPHRYLLRQGTLRLISEGLFGNIKILEREVFLFNDILVWSGKGPPYKYKGMMQLSSAKLEREGKDKFVVSNSKYVLVFYEPNSTSRKAWMRLIQELIITCKQDLAERRERIRGRTNSDAEGIEMHAENIRALRELHTSISPTLQASASPKKKIPLFDLNAPAPFDIDTKNTEVPPKKYSISSTSSPVSDHFSSNRKTYHYNSNSLPLHNPKNDHKKKNRRKPSLASLIDLPRLRLHEAKLSYDLIEDDEDNHILDSEEDGDLLNDSQQMIEIVSLLNSNPKASLHDENGDYNSPNIPNKKKKKKKKKN